MADHKVHPMPANPSAPPYSRSSSVSTRSSTNSVAIQMPDVKSTRKEQEQSLMHTEGYNQQKDFIYKTPAPLPPDHPSRRAGGRHGRRRSCYSSCCCCIGILCAVLGTIIIILGIAALVIYLVLQPKAPDFTVSNATVTYFNLSSQPISPANAVEGVSSYLNADVTFVVLAENPNKKIGIYYDVIDVDLSYESQSIGTGSIPAYYQGHQNTTTLYFQTKGQDVGLNPAIGSALQSSLSNTDASILLHTRTMANVRIKIGSWKTRDSKFQIDCDVEMSNPTAPNPHLLSKHCSFKVKKLMI